MSACWKPDLKWTLLSSAWHRPAVCCTLVPHLAGDSSIITKKQRNQPENHFHEKEKLVGIFSLQEALSDFVIESSSIKQVN